jgi:hypothetical protein
MVTGLERPWRSCINIVGWYIYKKALKKMKNTNTAL